MINQNNFTKFNGCSRQAYYTLKDPKSKSLADRRNFSSRLRDVQNDMLKSFPDGVWVYGDLKHSSRDTADIIAKGEDVIYNATFTQGRLSACCDVIMKGENGYDIYAVRPTSRYTKWIDEVLFAKIVMEKAGFTPGNCYVCAIDREGTKGKALTIVNVNNASREMKLKERIKNILPNAELSAPPKSVLSKKCGSCAYMEKCYGNDGESIFSLKSIPFTKKMSLFQRGIKTVEEYALLPQCDEKTKMEIKVRNTDEDVYSAPDIKKFLSRLHYPLGFLDFETMEVFEPNDDVLSPMDTVITQFSYHVIDKKGGEISHFEFIGDGYTYPEREAAKKLTECIGGDHCVLMYSAYEKTCIGRLMERLPEYSEKLRVIQNNLVDLEEPFAKKYLINRRMEGKSSLKKVLPALYPENKNLSYKMLAIKNGQQAESVYARLKRMNEDERKTAIKDLKEYCALDTLAMIKLWEKLELYGNM